MQLSHKYKTKSRMGTYQRRRSPPSEMTKRVGVTLSTATILPSLHITICTYILRMCQNVYFRLFIMIPGDGQTRHNVNVANCYLPEKKRGFTHNHNSLISG